MDEEDQAGESHSPTKTPRQHGQRDVDEAKKRLEQAQEEAGEARKEGGYHSWRFNAQL